MGEQHNAEKPPETVDSNLTPIGATTEKPEPTPAPETKNKWKQAGEYFHRFIHDWRLVVGAVVVILGSFALLPLRRQNDMMDRVMMPIILILSLLKLRIDLKKHDTQPGTRISNAVVFAIVIFSGAKTITDLKARWIDPIRTVSGSLHITFDHLIPPGQLEIHRGTLPGMADFSKGPLNRNGDLAFLTVSDVQIYSTGKQVGTAITADQVTHVTFMLTSDSAMLGNHLETISSKKLDLVFDYLSIDMLVSHSASDCMFTGVLYLVVNGNKEYAFNIPRHVLRDTGSLPFIPIYAPLNDAAVESMHAFSGFPKDPNFKLIWRKKNF